MRNLDTIRGQIVKQQLTLTNEGKKTQFQLNMSVSLSVCVSSRFANSFYIVPIFFAPVHSYSLQHSEAEGIWADLCQMFPKLHVVQIFIEFSMDTNIP